MRDIEVHGAEGPLRARLFDTIEGDKRPALIFFHGGGFVLGDLETHDGLCRRLAHEGGFRIIAVDYRLAPEHPFPSAWEDCVAAASMIASNAALFGVDLDRLSVGGDSAGGNLAAGVARHAARVGAPRFRLQLLMCPVVDLRRVGGSRESLGEGYFLTREMMDWFSALYLGGQSGDDERCSLLAAPLSVHLAPAYLIVAGLDPLRDEGRDYASRLRGADIPVTLTEYADQIHDFVCWPEISNAARGATAHAATAVRMATQAL